MHRERGSRKIEQGVHPLYAWPLSQMTAVCQISALSEITTLQVCALRGCPSSPSPLLPLPLHLLPPHLEQEGQHHQQAGQRQVTAWGTLSPSPSLSLRLLSPTWNMTASTTRQDRGWSQPGAPTAFDTRCISRGYWEPGEGGR